MVTRSGPAGAGGIAHSFAVNTGTEQDVLRDADGRSLLVVGVVDMET